MKITFTVPGEPQGKGRARAFTANGHIGMHTPDKTVLYENLIKMEYSAQANVRFADYDRLAVNIKAFCTIPKSATKKVRDGMASGLIRPIKKPDADNIIKVVCDALNGIAYRDDSQIVTVLFSKEYSDNPRVEVILTDLKGETNDKL